MLASIVQSFIPSNGAGTRKRLSIRVLVSRVADGYGKTGKNGTLFWYGYGYGKKYLKWYGYGYGYGNHQKTGKRELTFFQIELKNELVPLFFLCPCNIFNPHDFECSELFSILY